MPATSLAPAAVPLAAVAALLTAAAPPAPLIGTYRADCAPYDGPALRITLATPHHESLELAANVPLARMTGRWVHADISRPGTAMILLCREAPERVCTYPLAGSFTVSRKTGATITGTYGAWFRNGSRLSGSFRARAARNTGTMRCG